MLAAIEAGGTKMVVAVAHGATRVLARQEIPTTTPADTFAAILALFSAHAPLAAVGVASFGPVEVNPASPDYGVIFNTPKPGWSGANFR